MAGGSIDAQTKRMITHLDRISLEDKFIEAYEENILLKKHAKSQEEKMKKLVTKLLKLSSDEKKIRTEDKTQSELEDKMAELIETQRALEKQNSNLKGKVTVLKQQLESRLKRQTPYDHVPSKINSGLGKRTPRHSLSSEDISATKRKSINSSTQVSPGPVRYGRSLLDAARKENEELEELVLSLKEEVRLTRAECDKYKEGNKLQSLSHQETVLQLQQQIQLHLANAQRASIEEDVEKIKLQRELQDKHKLLQINETRCSTLESSLQAAKSNSEQLLNEMEHLKSDLKQEQQSNRDLQNQVKTTSIQQKSIVELQDMLTDLKFEKDLLKQRNDRLMKSLMSSTAIPSSGDSTNCVLLNEKKLLNEKVTELEERLTNRSKETQELMETLSSERETSKRLKEELANVKNQNSLLQDKNTQLKKSFDEQIKENKKQVKELSKVTAPPTTHLATPITPPTVNESPIIVPTVIDSSEEVEELRLAYNQICSELEKTKELLSLQSTVSVNYKRELEIVNEKLKEQEVEFDRKLKEKMELLELKSNRIKKLEAQLKELAYRTAVRQKTESVIAPQSHDIRSHDIRSHDPIPVSPTEQFQVPVELQEEEVEETDGRGTLSLTDEPHPPTDVPPNGSKRQEDIQHTPDNIEEDDLTEVSEDTMFEDTSLQSEEELPLSPLTVTPTPSPTKPSVIIKSDNGDITNDESIGDSLELSNESEEENEVKSKLPIADASNVPQPPVNILEVRFSLTIVSFTIEEDTPLALNSSIDQIFVEYQLLDFDSSELETPVSLPKPFPGKPATFNFRKEFVVLPQTSTMQLLQNMFLSGQNSTEQMIPFNVVSDPPGDDNDLECQELGTCNVNLVKTLLSGPSDSAVIDEDVLDIDNEDEVIGFLTIKINGLDSLRQFMKSIIKI